MIVLVNNLETKVIHNYIIHIDVSKYMDKINKWEKGNILLTVESQLVNSETTKELENQHLVVTIVTIVSGKNLK